MLKRIKWQYAIGEIIIVIIGVTVAFTLGRWSESAKNNKSKQEYLQSLIVDIDNEILHLNTNIEGFQSKVSDIKLIFPYLAGKETGRDSIAGKIFNLANVIHFYPNDITYKTMLNSGDLKLFKSFELKKALESHYSNHEVIQMDYNRQKYINEKYLGYFMIHHLDYAKIRRGDFSFIDEKMMKNIINSLYGTYNIAIKTSQEGIRDCETIKAMLTKELEKLT